MDEQEPDERIALVLDAGGARSAYQVGALQVILPTLASRGQQPRLLVGTSAGALLSAALTSSAHLEAQEQSERLSAVLGQVSKDAVMEPIWRRAPEVVLRYVSETLGLSGYRLRGLFGTRPLARTLTRLIDWEALHHNVESGRVLATAVTATTVRTGRVVMFTETRAPLPGPETELHRHFVRAQLDVPHLMASSAIPTLFPAVQVRDPEEVAGWYVDGATRRRHPLAPAIDLGADRVVVIGTGSLHPMDADPDRDLAAVDLGDGAATLLGAVMDDPLRHDLRQLTDVNELTADPAVADALERNRARQGRHPYRTVPFVAIAPEDGAELRRVAMEVFRENHGSLLRTLGDPDLQIVHRLLGSDSPLQGDLLSFLLFDPDFFEVASELGRRDAQRWVDQHPDLWRTGRVTRLEDEQDEPHTDG